ncbi:MAG: hypothetical protein ACJ8AO_21160, partial [Gemmatimonadaceae bacterium]
MNERRRRTKAHGSNPDPVTGAPGAHPLGTASGAVGIGTIATALGGVVAGPIGALLGAAVGAVAGGLIGKGAAEIVNPTVEDAHWRRRFAHRAYVHAGEKYERYQAAYRYGWEAAQRESCRR